MQRCVAALCVCLVFAAAVTSAARVQPVAGTGYTTPGVYTRVFVVVDSVSSVSICI